MKKITTIIIVGASLAYALSVLSEGRRPPLPSKTITVLVDGKPAWGKFYMAEVEEATCLSLRDMQRVFGGKRKWQGASRKFTYTLNGQDIGFTLDSSTVTIGGETEIFSIPVRFWGGQPYIPMAFVCSDRFQSVAGVKIEWEPIKRTLFVESAPVVSSPRFYSYGRKSRIVVELGPHVTARELSRRNGRLYIRLFGGRPESREMVSVDDGLVKGVEMIPHGRSGDLVVMLSQRAADPKVFMQTVPRAIAIEVTENPAVADSEANKEESSAEVVERRDEETNESAARDMPASPLMALSPIRTIVIDPGHGGKDVGAVGGHGTYEKDVNLSISLVLANLLEDEKRYNVILTRKDDSFVSLEDRTETANKHKADIFISIHCNAALNDRSNGFEIYFMSEKATDAAAASVARRENAVVELEGVTGKAKMKVQELLWSMAKTETMNQSAEVAALISKEVGKRLSVANRGVKQAGFYVLKGAAMPAVLVEAAFITNPAEEGILRTARYHKKLVDALYGGLLTYEKRQVQARLHRAPAAPKAGG
jgi:N-acetylmuramoyl-L-alanine amidase